MSTFRKEKKLSVNQPEKQKNQLEYPQKAIPMYFNYH